MRDAHGGQRRSELVGEMHVVEADHRDVLRTTQSALGERLVAAQRHQIVAGHDGGEIPAGVQQLGQCPGTLALAEGRAEADELGVEGKPARGHHGHVGGVAGGAGGDRLRARRVGDPPMTQLDQVVDRLLDPAAVIPDDRRRPLLVLAVEQHQRWPGVGEQVVVQRGDGRDPAVDLPQPQRLDHRPRAHLVVVGIGDQRGEAGGRQRILDPSHHRREQRVGQVRQDHANSERAARLQAAGNRVGRVAHLARGLGDARRGRDAHQVTRALVECPRGRRRVDPDASGDITKGHWTVARRSIRGARHRGTIVHRGAARHQPISRATACAWISAGTR